MATATTMQIDPVCGRKVSQEEAKRVGLTARYEQTEYCFCSAECREEFQSAPHYFLTHTPGPTDYGGGEDWQP